MNNSITDNIDKTVSQFAKADNGKLQISLVPMQINKDIAEVRMYGTNKYNSPNNWVIIEMQRYVDALLRHLIAFIEDNNSVDEESGIPHYKHAATNMAFICEMMREDWPERRDNLIKSDPSLQERIEELAKKANRIKVTSKLDMEGK